MNRGQTQIWIGKMCVEEVQAKSLQNQGITGV